MSQEPVVIPEKIYFKIGEVCELVGVQAHVLRYWETEFPMLSPQKNSSGQRSYRRRDVEIAIRIKELLYKEMFTIAGAKKKLQAEQREGSKAKPVRQVEPPPPEAKAMAPADPNAPGLFDRYYGPDVNGSASPKETLVEGFSARQREALKTLAANLLELREMLKTSRA
jgi:DNA-binding transcriptional MerR regulator